MAEIRICEFGWSDIELVCLFSVGNHLIIIINVDLLQVLSLLKQKQIRLIPSLIENIVLFSVAFPGMYFII